MIGPVSPELTRPSYRVPRAAAPVDLDLAGSEGGGPDPALLADLAALLPRAESLLRRYPDAAPLERLLAERFGLPPGGALVTAGADDALDRAFRALASPQREVVLPVPAFEMTARYARLSGARVIEIPWPDGAFPVAATLAATGPRTALIVLTSPNNPTGATIRAEDLRALSAGAPDAWLLVDLAYAEFAEEDLAAAALELPNALVLRSFSKALGLAGLRVGCALGPAEPLRWLRAAAPPYPVAGLALALAERALRRAAAPDGVERLASLRKDTRGRRAALNAALREGGGTPTASQAPFVCARVRDPRWLRDGLAGLGIGARIFPDAPGASGLIRLAVPPTDRDTQRAAAALRVVLAPAALLFDLDGVLADVSGSYREAILATARHFGAEVDAERVAAAKARGSANDDWALTRALLLDSGVEVAQAEVTQVFEAHYQGDAARAGLRERETLIPSRALLERLAARLPLAIVTGRPRADAARFLEERGLRELFTVVVAREDAVALKPDPAPVAEALRRLGAARAWLIGDTPDDAAAARAAGVLPLGVIPPGERADARSARSLEGALGAAGCARVLGALDELEEILP